MQETTVTDSDVRTALRSEASRALVDRMLPYLTARCVDDGRGGVTAEDSSAPKEFFLTARLLWIFSTAARTVDASYLTHATKAYDYLRAHFWDHARGGAYWTVTPAGAPLDTRKMTYGQAFLLYGLCAYYDAARNPEVLTWAQRQFALIETHARDPQHDTYVERFDDGWNRLPPQRHSAGEPLVDTTTNTLLHVLEAYTAFYRVWPKPHVEARLRALVTRFLDTVLDAGTHHLRMAFDASWTPVLDLVSYGHDAAASWLLTQAADTLRDAALFRRVRQRAVAMADAARADGLSGDGALIYASTAARSAPDRHWWPQSEAVVGFLNAHALSGEGAYLEAAASVWRYIEVHFVDRAEGGWYARVNRDGVPYPGERRMGRGKGPYHYARACLEVLNRLPAQGDI